MDKTIVLIPFYNAHDSIVNTLSSINENDKVNVLIVDDGSKVPLLKENIVEINKTSIDQLIIINCEKNGGIEKALNIGLKYILEETNYSFIARLDTGDLAVANRFEKQRDFLKNNPDISLLGGGSDWVDMNGTHLYYKIPPTDHKQLKRLMYQYCAIVHTTAMFRREVVQMYGYYPLGYKACEDHAYWLKMIRNGIKIAALSEILLITDVNPSGITVSRNREQMKNILRLLAKNFNFTSYSTLGLIRAFVAYIIPYPIKYKMKKNWFINKVIRFALATTTSRDVNEK